MDFELARYCNFCISDPDALKKLEDYVYSEMKLFSLLSDLGVLGGFSAYSDGFTKKQAVVMTVWFQERERKNEAEIEGFEFAARRIVKGRTNSSKTERSFIGSRWFKRAMAAVDNADDQILELKKLLKEEREKNERLSVPEITENNCL